MWNMFHGKMINDCRSSTENLQIPIQQSSLQANEENEMKRKIDNASASRTSQTNVPLWKIFQ